MNLKKLELGTHLVPGCPGLRVEKRATTTTFTWRRRGSDGRLIQSALGAWPSMSLAEAIATWQQARDTRHEPVVAVVTVKALVQSYVVTHLKQRRKAPQNVIDMLWRHLGDLEGMVAGEVTRSTAFKFLSALQGVPSIQRMMRTELAAAWNHGINAGMLGEQTVIPWSRVPVVPSKPRQRVLDETELAAWLKWLPGAKLSKTAQDALMLTLLTCCRSGEIVRMRWPDVDLDAGTWLLQETKNGMSRVVQLNEWTVGILRGRKATVEEEWAFPAKDARQHFKQICLVNALHRVRDACPVAGWSAHDLRRTGRTHLAMLGCPDPVGEAILGHKPAGIIGVYQTYRFDGEQREWINKWGAKLMALVG